MPTEEAKKALLSEALDHFQGNEKTALQRRRNRESNTSSTTTATPSAGTNYRLEQNENHDQYCYSNVAAKQQFSLNQVLILLAVYLGGGTLCFYLVRNQISGVKTIGILDAMYFCVVTMTTVGYGDLVPDTVLAKLLACAYVFTGMALGGLILGKAADYIVEKQELLLVRALHMREEVETQMKYKFSTSAVHLLVLIIVGTVFLYSVEGLELPDAFYCVCSTITTLGYGDESFSTRVGRVFAVFWIFGSTICLAQFFLYLAELSTESRQRSLAKWVLNRKLTNSDLEAADLDHDKVVSAAEFLLYKLKEMDKISNEDVSLLMETFKELDVDHSGTLTSNDIISSQSA